MYHPNGQPQHHAQPQSQAQSQSQAQPQSHAQPQRQAQPQCQEPQYHTQPRQTPGLTQYAQQRVNEGRDVGRAHPMMTQAQPQYLAQPQPYQQYGQQFYQPPIGAVRPVSPPPLPHGINVCTPTQAQYQALPQYEAVPQYQALPQYEAVPQYQALPQYLVVPQNQALPQYPQEHRKQYDPCTSRKPISKGFGGQDLQPGRTRAEPPGGADPWGDENSSETSSKKSSSTTTSKKSEQKKASKRDESHAKAPKATRDTPYLRTRTPERTKAIYPQVYPTKEGDAAEQLMECKLKLQNIQQVICMSQNQVLIDALQITCSGKGGGKGGTDNRGCLNRCVIKGLKNVGRGTEYADLIQLASQCAQECGQTQSACKLKLEKLQDIVCKSKDQELIAALQLTCPDSPVTPVTPASPKVTLFEIKQIINQFIGLITSKTEYTVNNFQDVSNLLVAAGGNVLKVKLSPMQPISPSDPTYPLVNADMRDCIGKCAFQYEQSTEISDWNGILAAISQCVSSCIGATSATYGYPSMSSDQLTCVVDLFYNGLKGPISNYQDLSNLIVRSGTQCLNVNVAAPQLFDPTDPTKPEITSLIVFGLNSYKTTLSDSTQIKDWQSFLAKFNQCFIVCTQIKQPPPVSPNVGPDMWKCIVIQIMTNLMDPTKPITNYKGASDAIVAAGETCLKVVVPAPKPIYSFDPTLPKITKDQMSCLNNAFLAEQNNLTNPTFGWSAPADWNGVLKRFTKFVETCCNIPVTENEVMLEATPPDSDEECELKLKKLEEIICQSKNQELIAALEITCPVSPVTPVTPASPKVTQEEIGLIIMQFIATMGDKTEYTVNNFQDVSARLVSAGQNVLKVKLSPMQPISSSDPTYPLVNADMRDCIGKCAFQYEKATGIDDWNGILAAISQCVSSCIGATTATYGYPSMSPDQLTCVVDLFLKGLKGPINNYKDLSNLIVQSGTQCLNVNVAAPRLFDPLDPTKPNITSEMLWGLNSYKTTLSDSSKIKDWATFLGNFYMVFVNCTNIKSQFPVGPVMWNCIINQFLGNAVDPTTPVTNYKTASAALVSAGEACLKVVVPAPKPIYSFDPTIPYINNVQLSCLVNYFKSEQNNLTNPPFGWSAPADWNGVLKKFTTFVKTCCNITEALLEATPPETDIQLPPREELLESTPPEPYNEPIPLDAAGLQCFMECMTQRIKDASKPVMTYNELCVIFGQCCKKCAKIPLPSQDEEMLLEAPPTPASAKVTPVDLECIISTFVDTMAGKTEYTVNNLKDVSARLVAAGESCLKVKLSPMQPIDPADPTYPLVNGDMRDCICQRAFNYKNSTAITDWNGVLNAISQCVTSCVGATPAKDGYPSLSPDQLTCVVDLFLKGLKGPINNYKDLSNLVVQSGTQCLNVNVAAPQLFDPTDPTKPDITSEMVWGLNSYKTTLSDSSKIKDWASFLGTFYSCFVNCTKIKSQFPVGPDTWKCIINHFFANTVDPTKPITNYKGASDAIVAAGEACLKVVVPAPKPIYSFDPTIPYINNVQLSCLVSSFTSEQNNLTNPPFGWSAPADWNGVLKRFTKFVKTCCNIPVTEDEEMLLEAPPTPASPKAPPTPASPKPEPLPSASPVSPKVGPDTWKCIINQFLGNAVDPDKPVTNYKSASAALVSAGKSCLKVAVPAPKPIYNIDPTRPDLNSDQLTCLLNAFDNEEKNISNPPAGWSAPADWNGVLKRFTKFVKTCTNIPLSSQDEEILEDAPPDTSEKSTLLDPAALTSLMECLEHRLKDPSKPVKTYDEVCDIFRECSNKCLKTDVRVVPVKTPGKTEQLVNRFNDMMKDVPIKQVNNIKENIDSKKEKDELAKGRTH